jgi:hypothetical protein
VSGLLPILGSGGAGGSGGLGGLFGTSLVQVAAGGLSGVLATSALVASGVVPLGGGPAGPAVLPLVACPDSGSVVAAANPGDKMLVTARNAAGTWLRVYVPGPAEHAGWVPAGTVDLLADGSGLPVADCGEVRAATGTPQPSHAAVDSTASPPPSGSAPQSAAPTVKATIRPTSRPTTAPTPTIQPTTGPGASPTAPPPTDAPTPTPNVGPKFTSQPSASAPSMAAEVLETGDCTGLTTTVTISTAVSDADGVATVQLWVRKPGAGSFSQLNHGFTNHGATWTAWIRTYWDHINTVGTLSFYAVARDAKGVATTSATRSIQTIRCDSPASISGGIDLPPGSTTDFVAVSCRVSWSFTINDPDGYLDGVRVSYSYAGPLNGSGSIPLAYTPFVKTWSGQTASLLTQAGEYTVSWQVTSTDVTGGTTSTGGTNSVVSGCGIN